MTAATATITADAMEMVDTVLPTDASYIESLKEPWKSIALRAIPPSGTEPLPSASHRLDQLEVEVRSQILNLFQDPNRNVQAVGDFWKSALDLCVHLVHHASHNKNDDPRYPNMSPRKLPLLLIEDCLDGLSLEDCQDFWTSFVEPALDEMLLGDLFWGQSNVCHLPFLRVCNQFLKVLETASSSDEQEWKGRILCVLSKGFSIDDRSAFKHWGSFHTSNSINYETKDEFEQRGDKSSSLDKYSLYQAFWSLQADFSNPNRIQVGDFIKKMRLILTALESSTSKRQQNAATTTPSSSTIRYMTSSSLLPTQLASLEFRSSVVSQFLIVASHLSSESAPLANALKDLLSRARSLLQTDNPQLYSILWDSILSDRESHWRKWKKAKCPASAFAPKRKSNDETNDDKAKKRPRLLDGPLGSEKPELEQVYELLGTDDLIKISQELIKTVPTLEQHLEPYVDALDPEAGIEDDYHPKNDALFSWRAMRLYAKHQLPLLKNCRKPADLERMTREWYRSEGKEIPGETPPQENDSDDESKSSRSISSNSSSSSNDEKEEEDEKAPTENDVEMKDEDVEEDEEDNEDEGKEKPDQEDDKESLSDAAVEDKEEEGEEAENDAESDKKEERVGEDDAREQPSLKEEDTTQDTQDSIQKDDDMDPEKTTMKKEQDDKKPEDDEGDEKDPKTSDTLPDEKAESRKRQAEDKGQAEARKEATSNPPSSGESEEDEGEVEAADKRRSPEPPVSRPNSRSNSRDRSKSSSHPPRETAPREGDRGHDRPRQPPPRGGRRDDGPPLRGGRRDDGPGPRGGRRHDGPGPRGGRHDEGPAQGRGGRRDEGPALRGGPRDGRHDDGPAPRGGGRRDDGAAPRGARQDDGSAPRGGGRRDDGPPTRGGGGGGRGDRRGRGGRDDGRFGRRHHR